MDNNDLEFDRAKFDAVWRRVKPEASTHILNNNIQEHSKHHVIHDDAAQLRDFMDDEACDAQLYSLLASKCNGCARTSLMRISSDERCHLKRLRAKYFILTGETYTPPGACPLVHSVIQTLRMKYDGERAGSASYLAAASETAWPDLADTYTELSRDEARHSKTIGCILENML